MGRWSQYRHRGTVAQSQTQGLAPPDCGVDFTAEATEVEGQVRVTAAASFPSPAVFLDVWVQLEGGSYEDQGGIVPTDDVEVTGDPGGTTLSKARWLDVESEPISDFGTVCHVITNG